MKPQFKIRARFIRGSEPPSIEMGFWDFHLPIPSRVIVGPMPLPNGDNKGAYLTARQIVVLLNSKLDGTFEALYDQQTLYQDIVTAKSQHYYAQRATLRVERPARDIETDTYKMRQRREREEREGPERVAQAFLEEIDPTLCYHITREEAFYITNSSGDRFMIDVANRNLVWLRDDMPVGMCVYLDDLYVQANKWDWTIAMYLYIKGAREDFIKTANEYRRLRYGTTYKPLEKTWKESDDTEYIAG